MGKRSDFERAPRDFYPTPLEAVKPLLAHLSAETRFIEPCAGDGQLIRHLSAFGHECVHACDIDPIHPVTVKNDATTASFYTKDSVFITNPPWDRKLLHPIIQNLSDQASAWLLFDADWMHTRQSSPYMDRLRKVVSVGRVKWIPDSKMTGKDNCCWYLFDQPSSEPCVFFGRV